MADRIVTTDQGPSRGMALLWLDGIQEQFNNIAAVAISGLTYQEKCEDAVTRALLRVIQQQADDSMKAINELRAMLETLPATRAQRKRGETAQVLRLVKGSAIAEARHD